MLRVAALLAASLLATPAPAAVLGIYEHDYGLGRYDPAGADTLGTDHVEIRENRADPFRDSFDFSDLGAAAIDSLALRLTFTDAGPNAVTFFGVTFDTERWYLDLGDTRPNGEMGLIEDLLVDDTGPLQRVIDAGTDAAEGTTVFADAIASRRLAFSFDEPANLVTDSFRLYSATLTVSGTAVVPLPIPFWMLMAALAGLGLLRRRDHQT